MIELIDEQKVSLNADSPSSVNNLSGASPKESQRVESSTFGPEAALRL